MRRHALLRVFGLVLAGMLCGMPVVAATCAVACAVPAQLPADTAGDAHAHHHPPAAVPSAGPADSIDGATLSSPTMAPCGDAAPHLTSTPRLRDAHRLDDAALAAPLVQPRVQPRADRLVSAPPCLRPPAHASRQAPLVLRI